MKHCCCITYQWARDKHSLQKYESVTCSKLKWAKLAVFREEIMRTKPLIQNGFGKSELDRVVH